MFCGGPGESETINQPQWFRQVVLFKKIGVTSGVTKTDSYPQVAKTLRRALATAAHIYRQSIGDLDMSENTLFSRIFPVITADYGWKVVYLLGVLNRLGRKWSYAVTFVAVF